MERRQTDGDAASKLLAGHSFFRRRIPVEMFENLQNEINDRQKREGITLTELLDLTPALRQLMNRITRYGELTIAEAAEFLGETPENTRDMLDSLVDKGFLLRQKDANEWIYQVYLARKRSTSLATNIWAALDTPE